MSLKVALFLLIAGACLIGSRAKPRDVGVQREDDKLVHITLQKDNINLDENYQVDVGERLLGHQCEFEGPVEHEDCANICIPKGYSYGLCVSFKCSCI